MGDLYATITSPQLRTRPASYVASILATAAALVLYLSPSLVASGVVVIFLMLLVADGAVKAGQGVIGPPSGTTRTVAIVNSLSSFILALIGFWVWKTLGLQSALGVTVAGYAIAAGWRLLLAPPGQREDAQTSGATNVNPDSRLNLGSHELFAAGIASRTASAPVVGRIELHWLMVVGAVLFVIHLARMEFERYLARSDLSGRSHGGRRPDGRTVWSAAGTTVAPGLAVSDPPVRANSMAPTILRTRCTAASFSAAPDSGMD